MRTLFAAILSSVLLQGLGVGALLPGLRKLPRGQAIFLIVFTLMLALLWLLLEQSVMRQKALLQGLAAMAIGHVAAIVALIALVIDFDHGRLGRLTPGDLTQTLTYYTTIPILLAGWLRGLVFVLILWGLSVLGAARRDRSAARAAEQHS